MNEIIIILLLLLTFVNIAKVTFFFLVSDLYEFKRIRKQSKASKNRKYIPLISIIVPAYNEEKVIYRSLCSIYKSNYKKFEVIVINDGSKDRTSEEVNRFINDFSYKNIRLAEQQNSGKGEALNNAIKNHAKGSIIMTMDADSAIDSEALTNAVEYFKDDSVVAMSSNIKVMDNGKFLNLIQCVEYIMGNRLKRAFVQLNMDYVIGGAGATIRKKVFKECKYYDTDTLTEDLDFTLKIINKGNKKNKIVYAPDVMCYTEGPLYFSSLVKQRKRWKYGKYQTFLKNKHLFFNRSKKYTKTLTWFFLPYTIFNDFLLLVEPLFFILTVFLIFINKDLLTLLTICFLVGFYSLITILSDAKISFKSKVKLILTSPLAYIFFMLITFVEYLSLLKCINNYEGIFKAKEINDSRWEHVERLGGNINFEA